MFVRRYPQSNSNNTLLFIGGAVAAAGVYYYLRERPVDESDLRKQAEQNLDKLRDQVAAGKAPLKAAEASVEQTLQNAELRMKELASEAREAEERKAGWLSWFGWGKPGAKERKEKHT